MPGSIQSSRIRSGTRSAMAACGLAGVAGVDGLVVALAQGEGDHVADRGFVVDDQDAFLHDGTVSSARDCVQVDKTFVTVS